MSNNYTAEVWLRIYDLSNGTAAAVSPLLLKRPIRGVWHSSIEVYGYEYFYGGYIDKLPPEIVEAELKLKPDVVKLMGVTTVRKRTFERFLKEVDHDFTPWTYDLVEWNCNHFADVCSRFLLAGAGIPRALLRQPSEVSRSIVGKAVLRLMELARTNPVVMIEEENSQLRTNCRSMGHSNDAVEISFRPKLLREKIAHKQRPGSAAQTLAEILVRLRSIQPPRPFQTNRGWIDFWPFNTCHTPQVI